MNDRHGLPWGPDNRPHVPRDELDAELRRVVERGRRRRARRATAGAAVAAVVVVVGAVGVVRRTGDESVVRTADQTTTTSLPVAPPDLAGDTTPTTATPSVDPRATRPAFAVAVQPGERVEAGGHRVSTRDIVVLDGKTGGRLRAIYRTELGVSDLSLSPDGKHVYFVTDSCGNGPVERVRVDGGPDQAAETITDLASSDPAVSPDGRLLAYFGFGECDGSGGERWALRVRDLATRADRVVAPGPDGWSMRSPTWSPDGRTLAVSIERVADHSNPELKTKESFVVFLDPSRQQDPLAVRRLKSPRAGFGFAQPTYLPDGSLFVIETPLDDARQAPLMVVVEAKGGATLRRVATGDPARSYRETGTDATGNHLFYISEPGADGTGRGPELRVADHSERTVVLATDVLSADW